MTNPYAPSFVPTTQELLDENLALQARVLSGQKRYRDANGNERELPTLSELERNEAKLRAQLGAASGPATNLVELQRQR